MTQARPSCLLLFMQAAATAFALALFNAGNSMAARMAMMAITTSSSIKVNPAYRDFMLFRDENIRFERISPAGVGRLDWLR
jgi:hypothetical protein